MGCLVPPTTWAPVVGWEALMKAWANQQNHTEAHQRRGTTADGSEDPRPATRGGGSPTEAHQRRGTTADGSEDPRPVTRSGDPPTEAYPRRGIMEDPRPATRGGGSPTEATHDEEPQQTARRTHGRRRGVGPTHRGPPTARTRGRLHGGPLTNVTEDPRPATRRGGTPSEAHHQRRPMDMSQQGRFEPRFAKLGHEPIPRCEI